MGVRSKMIGITTASWIISVLGFLFIVISGIEGPFVLDAFSPTWLFPIYVFLHTAPAFVFITIICTTYTSLCRVYPGISAILLFLLTPLVIFVPLLVFSSDVSQGSKLIKGLIAIYGASAPFVFIACGCFYFLLKWDVKREKRVAV